jgi:hypothetical protein
MKKKQREIMEQFLSDIKERETIRITSGEAFFEITKKDEKLLWEAYEKKGATIKVLAGPVICISNNFSEKRSEGNAYLRLAEKSALTIYPAPLRQIRHSRILGERKVLVEDYHESLIPLEERSYKIIDDPCVAKKCADDFDTKIEVFQSKGIMGTFSNHFNILCLTEEEIRRLKETLLDPAIAIDFLGLDPLTFHTIVEIVGDTGRLFDFLTFDKTVDLLKKLKIFQPDMILGA